MIIIIIINIIFIIIIIIIMHPIPKICNIFAFFLYLKEKLYILYIILTHLCISDPKIRFFFFTGCKVFS